MTMTRKLGQTDIEVSPLGLGCWAIGGEMYFDRNPDWWGDVDDEESIRAIHQAIDMGVNFLDTADAYGVGHSEEVIGKAIKGIRDKVVISTKFGNFGNESTRVLQGVNLEPLYIKKACDASLRRLGTDYIDVYFLHVWDVSHAEAYSVIDTLECLVKEGKIRSYGWSTDLVHGARLFAEQENCSAIQHNLNVFDDAPEILKICEDNNKASINRAPLAMGLLTGKFTEASQLPKNDVRDGGQSWVRYFKDGKPMKEFLQILDAVREILTSGGRTLAQGALAWIWGRSENTVPIPGFKTAAQVKENAGAMKFGPLTAEQMTEIERLLNRS